MSLEASQESFDVPPSPARASTPSPAIWRVTSFCSCLLLAIALVSRPAVSQSTSTACSRWSHQTALDSNADRLYIQGGNSKSSASSAGTWTNEFSALDVTKDFAVLAPPYTTLSSRSSPAVALAGLYANSNSTSLYLLGGEFSSDPSVVPTPNALWTYDIGSNTWATTAMGGNSVVRAAEGGSAVAAGAGSSGQPLAIYSFGHVDAYTDAGWSQDTTRLYLSSMQMLDLGAMTMQNVTQSAASADIGTSDAATIEAPAARADNTLTFVPGLGTNNQGILVSIGGGTSDSLVDNTALDVFDIGSMSWATQPTTGTPLSQRVNHCTVRGSAEVDGVMQHQLFIFGGQTLNGETMYNDVTILNVPSYTWFNLGTLSNGPSPRAGHSCDLIGNNMITIGGYLGANAGCDATPLSVLDTTSMSWSSNFNSSGFYQTPASVANVTGGIGSASSDTPSSSSSPVTPNSIAGQPYSGSSPSSGPADPASGTGSSESPSAGVTSIAPAGNINGGSQQGSSSAATLPSPAGGSSNGSATSHSSDAGTIAGAIVGGLAAAALLILGALAWRRRQRKQSAWTTAHRRLLSDISSEFSEDGSMISDHSLLVARRYEDGVRRPMMSAGSLVASQGHDSMSIAYPMRPQDSSAYSHYTKVSEEDDSGYWGSSELPGSRARLTSKPSSASTTTLTPKAYDYAQPSTVPAPIAPTRSAPDHDEEGPGGPSRSTSGKTKSSGLEMRTNDLIAAFEGEGSSPRLTQRPRLGLANPSKSTTSLLE